MKLLNYFNQLVVLLKLLLTKRFKHTKSDDIKNFTQSFTVEVLSNKKDYGAVIIGLYKFYNNTNQQIQSQEPKIYE